MSLQAGGKWYRPIRATGAREGRPLHITEVNSRGQSKFGTALCAVRVGLHPDGTDPAQATCRVCKVRFGWLAARVRRVEEISAQVGFIVAGVSERYVTTARRGDAATVRRAIADAIEARRPAAGGFEVSEHASGDDVVFAVTTSGAPAVSGQGRGRAGERFRPGQSVRIHQGGRCRDGVVAIDAGGAGVWVRWRSRDRVAKDGVVLHRGREQVQEVPRDQVEQLEYGGSAPSTGPSGTQAGADK